MPIVRIAHLADAHLDSRRANWPEQLACLDQIATYAAEARFDALIDCGDKVDPRGRRHALAPEREAWRNLCHAVNAAGASTVSIDGNHDVANDWSHLCDIPSTIHASAPRIVTLQTNEAEITLALLPYSTAADSAALNAEVAAVLGERLIWSTGPVIAVYHGSIKGAAFSPSQSLPASEPALDLDALAGRAPLVLAGHIHHAQTIRPRNPAAPVAIYPGSPWPHDHGEEDTEHGLLVHHFDTEAGRIVHSERLPLPYAPRRTLDFRYDGAAGLVLADTSAPLDPATMQALCAGAHIRARIEHPRGAQLPEWPALAEALTRAGAASVRRQSIVDAQRPAAVPALAADPTTGRATPRTVAELLAVAMDSGAIARPEHVDPAWLDAALAAVPHATSAEGYGDGSQAAGVREFIALTVENFGTWAGRRERFELSGKSGLIRLCGEVGTGKTTILTMLGPGLAFGTCPSRGTIAAYAAPGAGAFEVELIDGTGRNIRARVSLRSKARTDGGRGLETEQSGALWINGEPLAEIDGKISRLRNWLQANVYGSPVTFYLLVHASQRTSARQSPLPASLEEASPAQRDALFRWMLGLDAIDTAQAHATAREADLSPAARDYAAAEATAAEAQKRLEAATAAAAAAKGKEQAAAGALKEATAAMQAADNRRAEALADLQATKRAEAAAVADLDRAQAAQVATGKLQAARLATVATEAALKAAEAEHAEATEAHRAAELAAAEPALMARRKEELRQALTLAAAAENRAAEALDKAQATVAQAFDRTADARAEKAEAQERTDKRSQSIGSSQYAQQALDFFEAAAAERRAALEDAQRAAGHDREQHGLAEGHATAAASHAFHAANAAQRAAEEAERAAESLKGVGCADLPSGPLPCRLIDRSRALAATLDATRAAAASASATMEATATAATNAAQAYRRASAAHQEAIAALQAHSAEVREHANKARVHITRLRHEEAQAARELQELTQALIRAEAAEAPALAAREAAAARATEAAEAYRAARAAYEAAPEASADAAEATDRIRKALWAANGAAQKLTHAREQHTAALTALAAAQRTAEQCADAPTVAAATSALEAAREATRAAADAHATASNALAIAQREHQAAQREHQDAHAAAARTDGYAAAEAQAALAAIERAATLAAQAREAKQWAWLAGALRRLASLTVDASRAAIESRINGFLAQCWGARFSVAIEPETLNRDGESTRRSYEIVVTDADSEGQQERPFLAYSGGEQVALRQAIQWALLLLAAERTPAAWGVAILDEADGALSDSAQLDWQNMLRALVETSGLRQVFAVTHRGLEVASATIRLDAGKGAA